MIHERFSPTNVIVKNSLWHVLARVFSKIGGIVFVILIARLLLPEKFGIYHLAMSVTLILLAFIDAGINQTLIRFFSDAMKKGKKKLAILRYKYLLKLKFALTSFLTFILILLAYPLSFYLFKKPDLFLPLILSSFYLFVLSIESFYESFFYIEGKVNYLAIKQFLWESFRLFGIILLFFLVIEKYYVLGVISVLIISTIFSLSFILFRLWKLLPSIFCKTKQKLLVEDRKKINGFLFYLMLGSALTIIFGDIDIIIVGIFLPVQYVGYYSASWALMGGFASIFVISNILLPVFTKLKKERLESLLNRVFKYIYIFSIPLIFGMFLFGKYLIESLYGLEYLPGLYPLLFLSLLIFEIPLSYALWALFSAEEKPKYFVKILVFATGLNIILNVIFINLLLKISQEWAMTGASIATIISRFIYFGILVIYTKKELGITIRFKPIFKPLIASAFMISSLLLINLYVNDMNLIIGFLEIIFGALIYFLVLLIIKGITKEDISLITELQK